MTSPIQGSSSAFQHPHLSTQPGPVTERQLRSRQSAGGAVSPGTTENVQTGGTGAATGVQALSPDQTRHAAIKQYVTGVFEPYRTGANSTEIENLINSRTEGLFAMGHDRERVEGNLEEKAPMSDTLTAVSSGALSATPFIISPSVAPKVAQVMTKLLDLPSPNSAQVAGAVGGATAMVLKAVGDKLFEKATKKNLWLVPDEAHLSGAMQQVHKANQSVHIEALKSILGGLGYTGRNLGQAILSTLKNDKVDVAYNAMGNWAAGGVGAKVSASYDQRRGASGPAWLLARDDYTQRYAQLDTSTLQEQVVKGGVRATGDILAGVVNLNNWADGVGNAATAKGIADAVILAAGVAGASTITDLVAKQMEGSAPAVQALASGLANTSVAWAAYAAQGAGGTYIKAIAEGLDKVTEGVLTIGADAIGHAANQGLTAGISGTVRGFNATVRGAQAAGRAVANAPHDINEGIHAAGRNIAESTAPARHAVANATHNATDAITDIFEGSGRMVGGAAVRVNNAIRGQQPRPGAERDIPLVERRGTGGTMATTATAATATTTGTSGPQAPQVNPTTPI